MVWRNNTPLLRISTQQRSINFNMKKSKIDILYYFKSLDGRRLLINIKYNDKILTLLNIYAPNNENEKNDFFFHENNHMDLPKCKKS